MYKKSYKLEPVYIKFNDDITGIRKSVECYNNNFNNELAKIKKYYTNGFAQTVYELENGAKLYISYNGDELRVEEKIK